MIADRMFPEDCSKENSQAGIDNRRNETWCHHQDKTGENPGRHRIPRSFQVQGHYLDRAVVAILIFRINYGATYCLIRQLDLDRIRDTADCGPGGNLLPGEGDPGQIEVINISEYCCQVPV